MVEAASAAGVSVITGRFRAMMDVELVNAGPVTILLDTDRTFLEAPRRGSLGLLTRGRRSRKMLRGGRRMSPSRGEVSCTFMLRLGRR